MMVGYIGHLYPGRGMEILGDFARRCDWADFHVVGGWPEDVALWKDRLKDEPNIVFHGHVAPSEVPRYLRALDVLIAPYQPVVTLHGGVGDNSQWVCPLKLFDYMAAGKPIICSDHPVIRETVEHERDALICAPTDIAGWAAALTRLRDRPDLSSAIARNALDKFTKHYSWEARAARVLDGLSVAAPMRRINPEQDMQALRLSSKTKTIAAIDHCRACFLEQSFPPRGKPICRNSQNVGHLQSTSSRCPAGHVVTTLRSIGVSTSITAHRGLPSLKICAIRPYVTMPSGTSRSLESPPPIPTLRSELSSMSHPNPWFTSTRPRGTCSLRISLRTASETASSCNCMKANCTTAPVSCVAKMIFRL